MIKKDTLINLGMFKQLFEDKINSISLVEVIEEEIAKDGSAYTVRCLTHPEGLECHLNLPSYAEVSAQAIKGDLWLAVFINNDIDQGFLVSPLNNSLRTMHPKARDGETVLQSRKDKSIFISNSHDATLTEPLILGNELKTWLIELTAAIMQLITAVATLNAAFNAHTHSHAAPGPPTPAAPSSTANTDQPTQTLQGLIADPRIDRILSDLAYIQEKGLT